MKKLDYDPYTGITTHHDFKDGKNIIWETQDVDPIVDLNKEQAKLFDKKRSWWHVGTIPNILIAQWSKECGHPPYSREWNDYALKQLDSSEYRKFNQNKIKLKR